MRRHQLDLDAFFSGCVLCTRAGFDEERMNSIREPRGAWRVAAERVHGACRISGFLEQLASAALGRRLTLVDRAGRKFPCEYFDRRPKLTDDRKPSVRGARDNRHIILLADRVIDLGGVPCAELDAAFDDLDPR